MYYSRITSTTSKDTTVGQLMQQTWQKKSATVEQLNTANISFNEWNQIYLQLKSNIEFSYRRSKSRMNPNPNLNNLVIGFYHQNCAFWRIGLNGYWLLLLRTSKSGFAKSEEKDGLLMHALIPAVFSLFFLPLSFFISFSLFFLLLVSYYSLIMGYSPFSLSFSWVPLSRCLSLSLSLSKCLP